MTKHRIEKTGVGRKGVRARRKRSIERMRRKMLEDTKEAAGTYKQHGQVYPAGTFSVIPVTAKGKRLSKKFKGGHLY